MMNRTQIYLSDKQQVMLRKKARQRNTTVAAIVRELIDEGLHANKKEKPKKHESLFEAAKRINKLGPPGPKDLASRVDYYLYGRKY
jgi:hypothetical protein